MDKKNQIGEIVERSKNLESMLKKLDAEGRGMHELISSIQEKLEPELNKKLRFIATIRNQAIHEPEFDLDKDFEAFCEACAKASQELEKVIKPKKKLVIKKTEKNETKKKPAPTEPGFNYLFLLPFLPGINIIYFIFILILSVVSSTKYVILLMLYLLSFATIAEGITNNKQDHIIIGVGVFIVLHVCNIFIKSIHFPKLRYIPILNITIVIGRIKNVIHWRLFFFAILFIAMTIASVFLVLAREQYIAGAVLFALAYFGGIILFICAGKKIVAK